MLLMAAVVVGGILVGLALGGSLRNLSEARFRWWPLAIIGLALQFAPVPSRPGNADHWLAAGLLTLAYGCLLVFVGANIRLPGFALIALGFALNALVISLNGGMPVRDHALHEAAGSRYRAERQRLLEKGGLKHHLAGPGDVLLQFSDSIGLGAPVGNVFSPGDLIAYAGVAWALAGLTRTAASTGRPHVGSNVGPERARALDEPEEASAGGQAPGGLVRNRLRGDRQQG